MLKTIAKILFRLLRWTVTLCGVLFISIFVVFYVSTKSITNENASAVERFLSPTGEFEMVIGTHEPEFPATITKYTLSLCKPNENLEDSADQILTDNVLMNCTWLSSNSVSVDCHDRGFDWPKKIGHVSITWNRM